MFKKLALASLLSSVICGYAFSQISYDTTGAGSTTTVSGSPIALGGTGGSGGLGGLGGTSSSMAGSSISSGNTSGNTSITSNYSAPKIPVSTAFSPANHPTAPCMGSTSIGGTAVLFGFSAGSSWEATECMTFEAARSFDQVGMFEDALAIKCTSKYSAAAPSCIRLRQQRERDLQKAQSAQYERPQLPVAVVNVLGSYTETIDPITGYKTIIDTRGTLPRPITSR